MSRQNITADYLHNNLRVLGWNLDRKGLYVYYELNGDEFHLMPDAWYTTCLLNNCLMIEGRRTIEGHLQVCFRQIWQPFRLYTYCTQFSENDIKHLAVEHHLLKHIPGVRSYSINDFKIHLN